VIKRYVMTGNPAEIPDFSNLTCTNLMIRLKILLKKSPEGSPVRGMMSGSVKSIPTVTG
jgi:hypothetical protein